MIASELIVELLPPLKPSDTCEKAMKWMSEFKLSHLPVVEGHHLVGIVSEENLYDLNSPTATIKNSDCQLINVFVHGNQHIFEVMSALSENSLSVMPILDKNETYIGSTTLSHVMNLTSNTTSVKEPGGVIVLEVNQNDYSLAQIAQIVESNNARILSSFITSKPESTKMEITIKINVKELGRIIQTFERYEYAVIKSYQELSDDDDLQSRYDQLMKFLDI